MLYEVITLKMKIDKKELYKIINDDIKRGHARNTNISEVSYYIFEKLYKIYPCEDIKLFDKIRSQVSTIYINDYPYAKT